MSRLRIALLNAAHDDADTLRNFRREVDADLVEYSVTDHEYPDTFAFDGCILTGSESSVYWDEDWIGDLKAWVGEAIDRGLPFLGICYGHQLLAEVLGGEVSGMGEYELGYREIEQTADSPIFAGIDERFSSFTTHSDRVTTLPPGAEQLATNDYGNHGFRKGDVFGLQFHPEYDMATARAVTSGKDLPEEQLAAVHEGINRENYDAACEAKLVFENFTDYVRKQVAEDGGQRASADD